MPSSNFFPVVSAAQFNYQGLIEVYNISQRYQQFLLELGKRHVVIIADDSGSMNSVVSMVNGIRRTRWDDLMDMLNLVIRGTAVFDPAGIDVHFLNRGSLCKIIAPEQLLMGLPDGSVNDLRLPPRGDEGTPLVAKLAEVMNMYAQYDKDLLIIVATDGHPNEGNEALFDLMARRDRDIKMCQKFPLSFLMCTEEEEIVTFYDELKEKKHYRNIEITESYEAERREVIEKLHKDRFTPGDHIVKMLLGPINSEIAMIDQPKTTCCTIM
jgi:hypothetical protein